MYFDTLDYLRNGNVRQQQAFDVLTTYKVFEALNEFDPILAGTVPIEIDIVGSDLDILCCWTIQSDFVTVLKDTFGMYSSFSLRERVLNGQPSVIANFDLDGVPIEIFGQAVPVRAQMGYRHMMIEHRLLSEHGDEFRHAIIQLKESGMKTEPAFAKLLGLQGDPYQALLKC